MLVHYWSPPFILDSWRKVTCVGVQILSWWVKAVKLVFVPLSSISGAYPQCIGALSSRPVVVAKHADPGCTLQLPGLNKLSFQTQRDRLLTHWCWASVGKCLFVDHITWLPVLSTESWDPDREATPLRFSHQVSSVSSPPFVSWPSSLHLRGFSREPSPRPRLSASPDPFS